MATAIAVAAVLAVAIGWWSWWSRPSGSWACEADDRASGCVADARLRPPAAVDDLTFRLRGAVPVDLTGDGTEVVVALAAERPDRDDGEALVARFDTATGEMVAELLRYPVEPLDGRAPVEREADPAPRRVGQVNAVAVSPDGSRVAVLREVDESLDDGGNLRLAEVAVLDLDTGAPLVDFFDVGTCTGFGALGLSADNSQLQCDFSVYDLATDVTILGQVSYDTEGDADAELDPLVGLRGRCTVERICISRRPGPRAFVDRVSGDVVAETERTGIGSLARFDDDGAVAWFAGTSGPARDGIDRLVPRRTGPTTLMTAIDVGTGAILGQFESELLLPLSESVAVEGGRVAIYDRESLRFQVLVPDWVGVP